MDGGHTDVIVERQVDIADPHEAHRAVHRKVGAQQGEIVAVAAQGRQGDGDIVRRIGAGLDIDDGTAGAVHQFIAIIVGAVDIEQIAIRIIIAGRRPLRRVRKQVHAVELAILQQRVDLGDGLIHFGLERGAILRPVDAIGRLERQFAHPLQAVLDLAQYAFGRLGQRYGVGGVALGHFHAAQLAGHGLGDGHAGRIILGRIDPLAGRQFLACLALGLGGRLDRPLRAQRRAVGSDHAHGMSSIHARQEDAGVCGTGRRGSQSAARQPKGVAPKRSPP